MYSFREQKQLELHLNFLLFEFITLLMNWASLSFSYLIPSPFLPPSLPTSLPSSLARSLPCSLPPFFPCSLPPSLPYSLLPPSLPPSSSLSYISGGSTWSEDTWKGRDFTIWSIQKGRENCYLGIKTSLLKYLKQNHWTIDIFKGLSRHKVSRIGWCIKLSSKQKKNKRRTWKNSLPYRGLRTAIDKLEKFRLPFSICVTLFNIYVRAPFKYSKGSMNWTVKNSKEMWCCNTSRDMWKGYNSSNKRDAFSVKNYI